MVGSARLASTKAACAAGAIEVWGGKLFTPQGSGKRLAAALGGIFHAERAAEPLLPEGRRRSARAAALHPALGGVEDGKRGCRLDSIAHFTASGEHGGLAATPAAHDDEREFAISRGDDHA